MLSISMKEGNEMLIVGQVCTEEEQEEVLLIAKVFVVGERIRVIASQYKEKKKKS